MSAQHNWKKYDERLALTYEITVFNSVKRIESISGGDALEGHTRSHPEHDG